MSGLESFFKRKSEIVIAEKFLSAVPPHPVRGIEPHYLDRILANSGVYTERNGLTRGMSEEEIKVFVEKSIIPTMKKEGFVEERFYHGSKVYFLPEKSTSF